MLDESLQILTAPWSGEPVHHRGEHYTVDGMRFLPRPLQQPAVPVWVGGFYGNPAPLRRAARYQGFIAVNLEDPDQLAEIVMRTPDGHGRLELTKFHTPTAVSAEPENAPGNTLGLRSIMFAVDDIDATIASLRAHGAELVGEVAQYQDSYRLCYVRGSEGIIVALAEQLT